MKQKNLFCFAGAILAFFTYLLFSGCSKETSDPQIEEKDYHVEIVDSGSVTWYDHYSAMLALATSGDEEDELLALYAEEMLKRLAELEDNDQVRSKADVKKGYAYQYCVLKYDSESAKGDPITLSELVAWPRGNVKPSSLIIGCHATITSDSQAPSNYTDTYVRLNKDPGSIIPSIQGGDKKSDVGMLIGYASSAFFKGEHARDGLVIIPDYEGYGISNTYERCHPFLNESVLARQVYDGVKAAKEWFVKNKGSMASEWKSYSIGYSQGGGVAMAVHKYIETHNVDQLNFAGSVCGDGPYDPVANLQGYVDEGQVHMPVVLPLILKSMCDFNPYMTGYFPDDYFTEEFLSTGILDWLAERKMTTDEIDNALYQRFKKPGSQSPSIDLDQILRPEVIAYIKDRESVTGRCKLKMQALERALEMNNLTKGWTPNHPLYCFHSTRDQVVLYCNYESAYQNIPRYVNGVIYTNDKYYNHVQSGVAFYLSHCMNCINDLLDGKSSESNTAHSESSVIKLEF